MNTTNVTFTPWPHKILLPGKLPKDQVDLWATRLDVGQEIVGILSACISPDEIERAQHYVSERDRRRFKVARGFLRHLLTTYTGVPAHLHRFDYGARGKPRLPAMTSSLHFNVTHSGELAVIALTANREAGVDIEEVRPIY